MKNVHDYHIVSYEVDHKSRRITLKTLEPHLRKSGQVMFSGVKAYDFRGDAFSNIIYDISEIPLNAFYEQFQAELREQFRLSGAGGEWVVSYEAAQHYFLKEGLKIWELNSSMGLYGWIIAMEADVAVSEMEAPLTTKPG